MSSLKVPHPNPPPKGGDKTQAMIYYFLKKGFFPFLIIRLFWVNRYPGFILPLQGTGFPFPFYIPRRCHWAGVYQAFSLYGSKNYLLWKSKSSAKKEIFISGNQSFPLKHSSFTPGGQTLPLEQESPPLKSDSAQPKSNSVPLKPESMPPERQSLPFKRRTFTPRREGVPPKRRSLIPGSNSFPLGSKSFRPGNKSRRSNKP